MTIYRIIIKFGPNSIEVGDIEKGTIPSNDPFIEILSDKKGFTIGPYGDRSLCIMTDTEEKANIARISIKATLGILKHGYDNFVEETNKRA